MTNALVSPRAAKALTAAVALLLAGCTTVGPTYAGAPAAAPVSAARGAFVRAGSDTTTAVPIAQWWRSLDDPMLDALIAEALAQAPSVAIAEARVAQARATLAANRTANTPSLNASAAAPIANLPGNVFDPQGDAADRSTIDLYNVGFDSSWEVDLFGRRRRTIEGAAARVDAAEASVADAQVTLAADVARTYVALRARQARAAFLTTQRTLDAEATGLARQRLQRGTAPAQPLAAAQAQLDRTTGEIATNQGELVALKDQLALLTGREPGALDARLDAPAPIPVPPREVAIGDPARLLRNRPDIRAAERALAAANAEVGVKTADRFPRISFLGNLGIGGGALSDVLNPGNLVALILPRISLPIFDGGRGEQQLNVARGQYAEAEGRYRQTVLAALQDAEGSLTRYGQQRIAWGRALAAEEELATVARLQNQRARAGTASRTDAIAAERQRLQAGMAAVEARASTTTNFIAVNKALGLGWAPRDPAPATTPAR